MVFMSLRNWTRAHTYGLLVGFLSPLVFIPIVMLVLATSRNYPFGEIWDLFWISRQTTSKVVSLAIISNLIWFYIFLNREKYAFAMGIILGTLIYFPYIAYVNLFT
jgi:hypothetical protein